MDIQRHFQYLYIDPTTFTRTINKDHRIGTDNVNILNYVAQKDKKFRVFPL